MTTKSIKIQMEKGYDYLFPVKAHTTDAGYDLKAKENVCLIPGEVTLIATGVHIELPNEYEAQIRPRSGLALKHSITFLNSPGTIDAGYRGEIGVIAYNAGKNNYYVNTGDRIAQMVICKLPNVTLAPSLETLSSSSRGINGIGSTGV